MSSQTTKPRRGASPELPPEPRGRWLTLARVFWLAIVLVTACIFAASVSAYFSLLGTCLT